MQKIVCGHPDRRDFQRPHSLPLRFSSLLFSSPTPSSSSGFFHLLAPNGTLIRALQRFFAEMMRLQTYAGFSFLATMTAVYHAFNSRGQFYPAMVYLSNSKICFVLLVNMGLVMMCMLWQLVKRIFLGPLREAEVERLNEQAWREVMEILFAITIFRQDFSVTFVAMVTALLLIKALHWLAQKRVEYIETTPTVPLLSHIRIVSFMVFLLVVDCLLMYSSLWSLIETSQASVDLFFAFEYTILASTTISTFIKYVFYVTDMLMEGQWEKKAMCTFYLELVRDLFHLSLYICFFLVIFRHYGIPLHLIRELYETFRSFRIRVADYIRYRKITSNMNERFPDATPEELNASDATCIICREEMVTAKKLLCGHLFHVHCLRSWLERQHTCPTCRALVVPPENGPAGSNRQHLTPSDRNAGSSGAGTSSQASGSNVAGDYLSQQQARIKAATLAASLYEKSYFYPPTNTFFGSPRPSPQVNAPNHDADNSLVKESSGAAASSAPLEHQQPLFFNMYPHAPVVFRTPMSFLAPESIITSTRGNEELQISLLKAQQSLVQTQIEILQSQLKASQQPKGDESSVGREDAEPAANGKGKAIASSSASRSDCGRHGEIEDADTE